MMCDTLYGKATLKDITRKQKKTKQKKHIPRARTQMRSSVAHVNSGMDR